MRRDYGSLNGKNKFRNKLLSETIDKCANNEKRNNIVCPWQNDIDGNLRTPAVLGLRLDWAHHWYPHHCHVSALRVCHCFCYFPVNSISLSFVISPLLLLFIFSALPSSSSLHYWVPLATTFIIAFCTWKWIWFLFPSVNRVNWHWELVFLIFLPSFVSRNANCVRFIFMYLLTVIKCWDHFLTTPIDCVRLTTSSKTIAIVNRHPFIGCDLFSAVQATKLSTQSRGKMTFFRIGHRE